MRRKSIQDPPSIAKLLICALVTVLVMSMVMVKATPFGVVHMEPHKESRSLKRLSTNITSDYTNKTRERRLTNLLNDDIIELLPAIASNLGTDLSQVEALQKYERYFEVISDFPSFLKGNDLKESSSKEVIEMLLRHVDRDTALISDLGLLDKKKAGELMSFLLSEWKEHGVTLEDALEHLMLGKSVDQFLDSELINVWGKFGELLTGVSGAPALRSMLKVLSEQFKVAYLAKALVVRHTAVENSMGGRLYRQLLLVWKEDSYLSQEDVFYFFGGNLGLSIWMDFVLLRAKDLKLRPPYERHPSSYRIEVLEWYNKKEEIPIRQLEEMVSDIKDLMNDRLINQKLIITLVMKKEVIIKRLTNKKLMVEELEYKQAINEQLMTENKERTNKQLKLMNYKLMNDESMSKSWLNKKEDVLMKELMKRKTMIEDLVKKESTIEALMKEESMFEDSIKEELEKMELITKNLIKENSWNNYNYGDRDRDIEEITKQRNDQNAVIKEWIKKYDTNEDLMNTELMDKELTKMKLKMMELRINKLINEKLVNDALMMKESRKAKLIEKERIIKKLIKNDLMMRYLMEQESKEKELRDKKLVNEGLTSMEMRNNEALEEEMRKKETINKEMTNHVLIVKEMQKWRGLLEGGTYSDNCLMARRIELSTAEAY